MAEHVLVVEHDDRVREAIAEFLKRAGMNARATSTVEGALTSLRRLPALVVLDLAFPAGDGIEVWRAVRELRMATEVAIIASSCEARLFESMTPFRPNALFGKPFNFEDFADWLCRTFGDA